MRIASKLSMLVLAGATLHASPSVAGVCEALRFELATLTNRVGPGPEVRKFSRAIVAQKRSLRDIERLRRQSGCSSGSVMIVDSETKAACSDLTQKKARMERNLAILEQKKIDLLSESESGLARQKLVARLEENDCREQPVYEDVAAEPDLTGAGDARLETIRVPASDPEFRRARFIDLGGTSVSGNYRTVCVRSCDGGFFPISSHASPMSFRRDAQVCSMMCPGVETRLYYHSIYEETDEMRSASTGERYGEMDNAYHFRTMSKAGDAECSCNFAMYHREMLRRESFINEPGKRTTKESAIVWVKPALRGDVEQKVEQAIAQTTTKFRPYEPDQKIRVIGPKFLPDAGIDFTAARDAATQ